MLERGQAKEQSADWVKAHRALLQMARERSALEGREGKGLLRALRSGVHLHLGYGSFVQYVERVFGYTPRTTLDKLRTAEALESLPELTRALASGDMSWSAVRELARVATVETEGEWLEASKGRTVRDIERLVAGREPGDRPNDEVRPFTERHVLRFDVAAETLATFREAMKELRQQSGGHLDDDAALLLMARRVLGGRDDDGARDSMNGARSSDAGRASYQLALVVCERCGRGFQEGNGEQTEVDAAIVDMARCDARDIGRAGNTRAVPEIETEAGPPETHVGLAEPHAPTTRATQTIPPALRRRVLARDSSRCVVPGCRHATFVDLHHVKARAEGGRHEADNLVVLCAAHHRAVHRGRLVLDDRASGGLRFRHADGTPYGNAPSPDSVATFGRVFRALRGLGFREHEARQALGAVMGGVADQVLPATPTAEELLRAALRALAPRRTTLHAAPRQV